MEGLLYKTWQRPCGVFACTVSSNPFSIPCEIDGFDPSFLDEQTEAPRVQNPRAGVGRRALQVCLGLTPLGGVLFLLKIKTKRVAAWLLSTP